MGDKGITRDKIIIRTSIMGILANVFLAIFKAIVGLLSNSIAVVLDAVNNLSDALSSVITVIGTKLATREPDKKHPLGHGRIEYLSAMLVAAIVLYAGITSLVESVKNIIYPEVADYSAVTLIVVGAAVVVKIFLGNYVKSVGKAVNSATLSASGRDALLDSVISLSVLVSAVIFITTGLSLEAYVGVIISAVIIKAGYEMLAETLNEILGKRADREITDEIKKTICEEEYVRGAYDLLLHSYGPDRYVGSVHVEIPHTMTAPEIDMMERRIAQRVLERHGIILAGIGIYSANTQDGEESQMRADITRMVMKHDGVLQIHGFYADTESKTIHFDVILDFELDDRQAVFKQIEKEVAQRYPDYKIKITMDIDV